MLASSVLFVLSLGFVSAGPAVGSAVLKEKSLAATGRQETRLTSQSFGRYAIVAKSSQGVGLQLISRMDGPREVNGGPGVRDGRLDVFLERGEYKLVTHASENGTGKVALDVRPFAERNGQSPPRLVEQKLVETELGDFEQRSYWVEQKARGPLVMEAAGRHLADLRIWSGGDWLVDLKPACVAIEPTKHRPLLSCRFTATLEPGLYLVTAYGGPSADWAEQSTDRPFYLRYGLTALPSVARASFTVSPFGSDRFLIHGDSDFFRLELPKATDAKISVQLYDPAHPSFAGAGPAQAIDKKTTPPVAEVSRPGSGYKLITITALASQPYVLQYFRRNLLSFTGDGDYFVRTLHSGTAADSVDATALLVEQRPSSSPKVVGARAVELSRDKSYRRRFNFAARFTLYLDVKEGASYVVEARGADVRGNFRIEPFFLRAPASYKSPEFQGSGSRWDLSPGIYVLTAEPKQKGILELIIKDAKKAEPPESPGLLAAQFGAMRLEPHVNYSVLLNQQPGVTTGLVVRPLPLDAQELLPIVQMPGTSIQVPLIAKEPGVLRARTDLGESLKMSVDGTAVAADVPVRVGSHTVAIAVAGKASASYSLSLFPERLAAKTPLPALPSVTTSKLPSFPLLTAKAPLFFDLEGGEKKTFNMRIDEPGLVRVESTGLLAVGATVRTRTITNLASASQNGAGRNFSLQAYLGTGDYQVTIIANEKSRGHMGVAIIPTRARVGGELAVGVTARQRVQPGEAVSYQWSIKEPGSYHLTSFGLHGTFRGRFEDHDGWPMLNPNSEIDLDWSFDQGSYRLVLLPEGVEAFQLTRLDRLQAPPQWVGHGPHPLPHDTCVEHEWLEPAPQAPRTPDVWELELPADAEARVTLNNGMRGQLVRADSEKSKVADIPAVGGYTGMLARGRYRLLVESVRANNHVQYAACLGLIELVDGSAREVNVPAQLPLSIGEARLTELTSFGRIDVRARLLDATGKELARSDDRLDDWNFHIARLLAPGRYTLVVEPVEAQRTGTVRVNVSTRAEVATAPLKVPSDRELRPRANEVLLMPVEPSAAVRLLVVAADASESMGLALEAQTRGEWRTLGVRTGRQPYLAVPLSSSPQKLRLRLWSVDGRGSKVRVSAAALTSVDTDEGELASGVRLREIMKSPAMAAVGVELNGPGVMRLIGDQQSLAWATVDYEPAVEATELTSVPTRTAWLVAPAKNKSVRAQRVILNDKSSSTTFAVPANGLGVCDMALSGDLLIAKVSSNGSRVGLALQRRGEKAVRDARLLTISGETTAVALLAPKDVQAIVWPSVSSALGQDQPEVELSGRVMSIGDRAKANFGRVEGSVKKVARAYELPRGKKRLRLAASLGALVILVRQRSVLSTHAAIDAPLDELLETDAELMLVAPPQNGSALFSIDIESIAAYTALTLAEPFERLYATSGTVRLVIAPDAKPGRWLHLRGASTQATLVGADGSIAQGQRLPVPLEGGVLLLAHAVGPLLVWLESTSEAGPGLWGSAKAPPAVHVSSATRVALSDRVQTVDLVTTEPRVFHLRAKQPMVVRLTQPLTKAPRVSFSPEMLALDVFVRDRAEVALRSIGDAPLFGDLEVSTSAVIKIAQGVGSEVLLAPGLSRFFSFAVTREGKVGVGIKALGDSVGAKLITEDGRELGAGLAQMHVLAPGTYLLSVALAASAAPAVIVPVVFGLELPDTGPTEEARRAYLQPPRGVEFQAQRASQEPQIYASPNYQDPAVEDSGADGVAARGQSIEEPTSDESERSYEEGN